MHNAKLQWVWNPMGAFKDEWKLAHEKTNDSIFISRVYKKLFEQSCQYKYDLNISKNRILFTTSEYLQYNHFDSLDQLCIWVII